VKPSGTADAAPAICFIVTCKGRLHHLRQTLPTLVTQAGAECVVVDYDCPDHAYLWVSEHFPNVRIARVLDAPTFNLSRARNIGAMVAKAPWLCFIDADIALAGDFSVRVIPMLLADHFYRPQPMPWDACGTVICPRDRFMAVEGYDEAIEGWGGEDDDLYRRLMLAGCPSGAFPGELLATLTHHDSERVEHYAIKNRWLNQRVNFLYLHIKYDLERQVGPQALTLAARRNIHAEVARTLLADAERGATSSRIEVNIPDRIEVPLDPRWRLKRQWVYTIESNAEAAAPIPPLAPDLTASAFPASAYLAAHAVAKLHLGCGTRVLDGWLNVDIEPCSPQVLRLDATQPFPFADASFDYLFSEHMIEHLSYPQGLQMLTECRRVLKPGGVLRIATPDLAFLVALYGTGKSALQNAYLEWARARFIAWAPEASDTFVINNFVRDWGHQFVYDAKTLHRALHDAGFTAPVACEINTSSHDALCGLEHLERMPEGFLRLETMIFEAARG
jgi:predicted SAM-dependent methyltransferase